MDQTFKILMSGSRRLLIRLSGKIDVNADFSSVRLRPTQSVEIDMIHVTSINSIGIRTFRDWICSLDNDPLVLSYCPKVFVDQINMVVGLLPKHAKVFSFYVPFYAEKSGEEQNILYRTGHEFSREEGTLRIDHPTVMDSMGERMAPDVNSARYFAFLEERAP